jgi:hypothetical protein
MFGNVVLRSLAGVMPLIIIGLVLFARWFDRRRLVARKRSLSAAKPSQAELLQATIDKVIKEFADRLVVLETELYRSPQRSTELLVFFIVDAETERSPQTAEIAADLDRAFRHDLLLSGYFRSSDETVSTLVMSRETYESPWFR